MTRLSTFSFVFLILSASQVLAAKSPSKSTLNVGMFFTNVTQYLDTGAIDLLAMSGTEYIEKFHAPKNIRDQAVKMNIFWINEHGTAVETTAKTRIMMTSTFKNVPKLDLLIVPGADPHVKQTSIERDFILKFANDPSTTALMSVCTGSNILTTAGALEGKNATAPYTLLRLLEQTHKEINWSAKRWVNHGDKFWTSGGITNGLDMMAAWMRDYFWDRPDLVKFVLSGAGVGDRGQEYSKEEMAYWSSFDMKEHDNAHLNGDLASSGMDHKGMNMNHGDMPMDHGSLKGMDHGSMAMDHGEIKDKNHEDWMTTLHGKSMRRRL